MRHRLDAGQLKITGFFADVRVRYVDSPVLAALDPEGLSFFNINTPEDLERARQIAANQERNSPASHAS
jgi:molybdopterin-guanine dinucleotide biosynthesis protein A